VEQQQILDAKTLIAAQWFLNKVAHS
jgi:hypothetical protein